VSLFLPRFLKKTSQELLRKSLLGSTHCRLPLVQSTLDLTGLTEGWSQTNSSWVILVMSLREVWVTSHADWNIWMTSWVNFQRKSQPGLRPPPIATRTKCAWRDRSYRGHQPDELFLQPSNQPIIRICFNQRTVAP